MSPTRDGTARDHPDRTESDATTGTIRGRSAFPPRVKICGVTRERDLDAAVAAGADAVGLISGVTVDTHRELDPERAADLAETVPPLVDAVLVTMADEAETVRERVAAVEPDVLQVHGLDPDAIAALSHLRVDVIAAVDAAAPDLDAYARVADAVLVDSLDDGAGGTGETHDWERTRDRVADLDAPIVLAGGLTPENVERAVRTVRPHGVDVATGVEADSGLKDHDAVARFVAAATGGTDA